MSRRPSQCRQIADCQVFVQAHLSLDTIKAYDVSCNAVAKTHTVLGSKVASSGTIKLVASSASHMPLPVQQATSLELSHKVSI